MKKNVLKRLLITFSIIFSAAFGLTLACGGDYGDWYGYSDFAPEPFVDNTYKPLLFEPYMMFYEIGYEVNLITRFNEDIVKDWSGYLKGKMSESDIKFFLLEQASASETENLHQYFSHGIKNPAYDKWSNKIKLNETEIKEFIEFIYLAKNVELVSTSYYDPWDYEEESNSESYIDPALISQIKAKYESTTNPFLKNRYWFQTMKAYFYSESKAQAMPFFNQTKNDVPKNTLYYRAVSYLAGIEYKSGNFALSNYLYSIVFDQSPNMRTTASYCFHPQEETDWNKTLAMAKTNDEKAALWALLGYYADPARAINEIYKLNPKNPHLDYLVTRLVNEQEYNMQDLKTESIVTYKSELKSKLNQDDINIISKIATAGNTSKPYLWNLAAGYLQTFNGNYAQARTYFDNSETQLPKKEILSKQLRLLRFINKLSELNKIDANSENLLLSDLDWLYTGMASNYTEGFRYDRAVYWSKNYLSALYTGQNNIVYAELFKPNDNFYLDNVRIETMKTFLEKSSKTPFEQLAIKIYNVTISDIYHYQAVMSTFQNDIDKAMSYISRADNIKNSNLPGNPFNGNIQDCHDCDHYATQKTKYSIYRFLEIIQIMKNKVKAGEDLYNNYLLLGNAFYNITHYGNARFFYEGRIIGESMGEPYMISDFYRKPLTDMSICKSYYQKAFDAASTKEQKAKCAYMLAKCERNDYYKSPEYAQSTWTNPAPDFKAWNGFKLLKSEYSDTKYYKDVLNECDYFSKYCGN